MRSATSDGCRRLRLRRYVISIKKKCSSPVVRGLNNLSLAEVSNLLTMGPRVRAQLLLHYEFAGSSSSMKSATRWVYTNTSLWQAKTIVFSKLPSHNWDGTSCLLPKLYLTITQYKSWTEPIWKLIELIGQLNNQTNEANWFYNWQAAITNNGLLQHSLPPRRRCSYYSYQSQLLTHRLHYCKG